MSTNQEEEEMRVAIGRQSADGQLPRLVPAIVFRYVCVFLLGPWLAVAGFGLGIVSSHNSDTSAVSLLFLLSVIIGPASIFILVGLSRGRRWAARFAILMDVVILVVIALFFSDSSAREGWGPMWPVYMLCSAFVSEATYLVMVLKATSSAGSDGEEPPAQPP